MYDICYRYKRINRYKEIYYLYHKPVGIICTNNLNIKDNIIEKLNLKQRVFCVGRLDKDTSGLIILTNDGKEALKQKPKKKETKIGRNDPCSCGSGK